MPAGCPAFQTSERIRFASVPRLEEIQEQMRQQQAKIDAGELPLGICEILAEDMVSFSGQEASIKEISIYHMGVPLYEFQEVPGIWPEEALCDPELDRASEGSFFEPAKMHYSIKSKLHGEHDGLVEVRGLKNDKIYCQLRRLHAEWIEQGLREITEIRSRSAFERLFMFDGDYGSSITESVETPDEAPQ